MSLSSKLIMTALKASSAFSSPGSGTEEILKRAKAFNAKQCFEIPRDRNIEYRDMSVRTDAGEYHCLRMKRPCANPNKAVIYIPGGGGVFNYCNSQLFLAKTFLKHVEAEIYYPFYPPTTACSIREAYTMIFECYKAMLNEYPAEKIAAVGVSSGATAVMDIIAWNNYYGFGLSMPKVAVVLSPGHVPVNDKEALEKAGADYRIHIEPGMPHTYACMRVNKACRDSYDEYVNEINKI